MKLRKVLDGAASVMGSVALWMAMSASTHAAISWSLNTPFTGESPASGSLSVTLTQEGDDVRLNVSTANLTSNTEFVGSLYLNYKGDLDDLEFDSDNYSSSPNGSVKRPSVTIDEDDIGGMGNSGKWDIKLSFSTSGSNGGAQRFKKNESISWLIEDATEADFLATSKGSNPLYVAAHIQGLGVNGNGSTKVTIAPPVTTTPVPEPSTYAAAALLVLPVLAQMKRRRSAG